MTVLRLLSVFIATTLIFGCSSHKNSLSSNKNKLQTSGGYIGADIRNAVVYSVPVDVQGQPSWSDDGTSYGGSKGYSSADGYYKTSIEKTDIGKATLFIAGPNSYEGNNIVTTESCELISGCGSKAWGDYFTVAADFKLTAAVGNLQDNMRVNVNWITRLAADMAYTSYIDENGNEGNNPSKAKDGIFTRYTIERGNIWLNKQFGLSDIISLRPIAPSKMNNFADMDANLREQGLIYGALLAGGQKLAFDSGSNQQAAFLSEVIKQQRDNRGQLYRNNNAGFSLCSLYDAAENTLSTNITKLKSQPDKIKKGVEQSAQKALQSLQAVKASHCAQPAGTLTAVEVNINEIKDWLDTFKNAKIFVDDLNERIVNIQCRNTDQDLNGDGQIAHFFDCNYLARSKSYFKDLQQLYESNRVGLDAAMVDLRDAVLDYSRCLNGASPCGVGYKGDHYELGALTITQLPVNEADTLFCQQLGADGKTCADPYYYAFDFKVVGTQSAGALSLTYTEPEKTENNKTIKEFSRVRVVYSNYYKKPPITAIADHNDQKPSVGEEPLGFDFYFPEVVITPPAGTNADLYKDLKLYLSAKLIGVKPEYEGVEKPYHYNLTAADVGMNVQGSVLGSIQENGKTVSLRNQTGLTLNAKFLDAANFYSKQLWPKKDDYFTAESGVVKQTTISNLFHYNLQKDERILVQVTQKEGVEKADWNDHADYLDIGIQNLGTNRFEVFDIKKAGEADQRILRKCSVNIAETNFEKRERGKVCSQATVVKAGYNLVDDLLYSSSGLDSFAIPAYGAYKPALDANNKIQWDSAADIDGKLVAQFNQGVDSLKLTITQELVDKNPDGTVKRAPLAIVKVNGNKKTNTSWEVATTLGLDYDYLVDILPTGIRAQSIYLSYFVRESAGADGKPNYVTELGALSLFRGGVKLFTNKPEGESIGTTLATRVDYDLDASSALGCGYNASQGAKDCKEIGYITFRGALVAVVREERAGVYVVRYSDGTFSILGGG